MTWAQLSNTQYYTFTTQCGMSQSECGKCVMQATSQVCRDYYPNGPPSGMTWAQLSNTQYYTFTTQCGMSQSECAKCVIFDSTQKRCKDFFTSPPVNYIWRTVQATTSTAAHTMTLNSVCGTSRNMCHQACFTPD